MSKILVKIKTLEEIKALGYKLNSENNYAKNGAPTFISKYMLQFLGKKTLVIKDKGYFEEIFFKDIKNNCAWNEELFTYIGNKDVIKALYE